MDFFNKETILLSKRYQLVSSSLFDNNEVMDILYYFK